MKLDVIADGQKGVINITSEQFIIEDLKAHVCKKLKLNESDFKVKVRCGDRPSIELIKAPLLEIKSEDIKPINLHERRSQTLKEKIEIIEVHYHQWAKGKFHIMTTVNKVMPDKYAHHYSYVLKSENRVLAVDGVNGIWNKFLEATHPNNFIKVYGINELGSVEQLLYKIRIIHDATGYHDNSISIIDVRFRLHADNKYELLDSHYAVVPKAYRKASYKLSDGEQSVDAHFYNGDFINFIETSNPNRLVNVYDSNNNKLLYKIRKVIQPKIVSKVEV